MKNRVKNYYGRKITSLEGLLENIETTQKQLLSNDDLRISEQILASYKNDIGINAQRLLIFKRHYIDPKTFNITQPPIDYFFNILQDIIIVNREVATDNAPQHIRHYAGLLELIFIVSIRDIAGFTRDFTDEQMKYREDFFNKRNGLPKDNKFRRAFVESYIDEEVYNRFYGEKEEEARRYDTEEEGELYTPEGAKEWDKHFNDLCDEYGEGGYKRHFTDEDYKALERPPRKGRDALLLCHYPIGYNRAYQNIELKEIAQRHGVNEALINKVIQIVEKDLGDRLPQIEKELEELERAEQGEGATPTS